MKISKKYLKSLNPCADRYENYLKHHKDFEGTLSEFLDLDKITHHDKVWVYFRSIPLKTVPLVAADFAEHVLHIFESKYPEDDRPRKAIEAARSVNGAAASDAVDAAYAARAAAAAAAASDAADAADAAAAAYAAADARAAYAAYATYDAAYDAAYAAYAARAAYAAYASADADVADNTRLDEEKYQIDLMKKYIK